MRKYRSFTAVRTLVSLAANGHTEMEWNEDWEHKHKLYVLLVFRPGCSNIEICRSKRMRASTSKPSTISTHFALWCGRQSTRLEHGKRTQERGPWKVVTQKRIVDASYLSVTRRSRFRSCLHSDHTSIYRYTDIHTDIHACMHTCIHTHIHIHTHIDAYMHTRIHTCMHA